MLRKKSQSVGSRTMEARPDTTTTATSTTKTTGKTDDESAVEQVFTVLYYKRKNKVHKSKGVKKMDGILKIVTTPGTQMVGLTTPNGDTVVAPRREVAPALNPMDLTDENDVIPVGGYDVEIVTRIGKPPPTSSARPSNINNIGVMAPKNRSQLLQRSAMDREGCAKPLLPRRPLVLLPKKIGPVPPSSVARNLMNSNPESPKTLPVQDSLLPSKRRRLCPTKSPLMALGPPREVTKRSGFVPLLKRSVKNPSGTPPGTAVAASNATATTTVSLPGAIGTIDLPHSIRIALKPHQRTGLVFLWNCVHRQDFRGEEQQGDDSKQQQQQSYRGGAILADEMGLGKTLMTIATICALYRQRRDKKYIIVCPSSLVSNWAKEFDKWLGSTSQPKRLVVKKGGEEGLHQIKVFAQDNHNHHSVLILSYDIFRLNIEHFRGMSSRLLVVDEGHRLKNTAGSLTLTALESLDCESRLLLTATPIQNVLSDFYTISNFCNPGILGDLNEFRRDFERPIAAANLKNCSSSVRERGTRQSRELELMTKTFMLRRLQKDVLKTMLPPRSEVLLFCRPSPAQAALYRGITASAHGEDALATLTSLRKLCLHPSLLSSPSSDMAKGGDVSLVQSGKLAVLAELLNQIRTIAPQDKVVIVSNFTSALGLIEAAILKPRNLSFLRLDGSTETSGRQSLVDTFNNTSSERAFCFMLSSKAGGCGLNLIGANRLIMVDPDWNPASDIQAMARVYRQGQEKPCIIYRLFTSGSVEEVICQRQIQKENLASRTVDSNKGSGLRGFSKEELKDCFTLKHVACDTKTKMGNSWPSYEGPGSIEACRCYDGPLLKVASSSSELAFVHVVEDTPPSTPGDVEDESDQGQSNTTATTSDEEEWQDDVLNDTRVLSARSAPECILSSDEENEFE